MLPHMYVVEDIWGLLRKDGVCYNSCAYLHLQRLSPDTWLKSPDACVVTANGTALVQIASWPSPLNHNFHQCWIY